MGPPRRPGARLGACPPRVRQARRAWSSRWPCGWPRTSCCAPTDRAGPGPRRRLRRAGRRPPGPVRRTGRPAAGPLLVACAVDDDAASGPARRPVRGERRDPPGRLRLRRRDQPAPEEERRTGPAPRSGRWRRTPGGAGRARAVTQPTRPAPVRTPPRVEYGRSGSQQRFARRSRRRSAGRPRRRLGRRRRASGTTEVTRAVPDAARAEQESAAPRTVPQVTGTADSGRPAVARLLQGPSTRPP